MKLLIASLPILLGAMPLPAQTTNALQSGLAALQQNHPAEALQKLSVAEREAPGDARVRNFRGIALEQLGRTGEAAEEYRASIRLAPDSPDAYRNLGHLEWVNHHPDAARTPLTTALKLAPTDPYTNYYLGRIDLDAGDFPHAIEHLEKSREIWPPEPKFYLALANAFLSVRQNSDARNALAHAQSLPLGDEERIEYGALRIALHDTAAGIEVFQQMRAAHPDASWTALNLALAQLRAGRAREAASTIAAFPDAQRSAAAWSILGIAASETHEYDHSIAAFRKAAQLAPEQEERWLDLTRELMEQQHYVDAVTAAQQGLSSLPRSYALRLRLGAAYMKSGQYRQAEEVFRDLIAQGDPQPTSAIGLAQVLIRETRPDAAMAVLSDAEKRLGSSFLLVYFHGIAADRAGKPDAALREFHEAVRMNPRNPEAHQWLGTVELRAGKIDDAIADLQATLMLDPNNQPARRLLAQAYAMHKQPEQAAQYLKQIEAPGTQNPAEDESLVFTFPPWEAPPLTQ